MTMFNMTPKGCGTVIDTNNNTHVLPNGYSIRVMAAGSWPTEAELTAALSRDLGLQLKPVYIGAWNDEKI